jgi:hypothetical protein
VEAPAAGAPPPAAATPAPSPAPAPSPPPLKPIERNPLAGARVPAAAETGTSAESGVRDLLARYEQALEARSITALKRVWPSLGGTQEAALRREFSYARSLEVEIENPHVAISGSSATVRFVRRYHLLTVDGQRLLTTTLTTMTARRAGSEWVIADVRFEALR